MHIQAGQAAATHNVVGLGDRSADPGRCALERKGGILELLVKHFALIVYAMIDDNRQEETEASIAKLAASMLMALS